jgi:hypothetical protein
LQGAEKIGSVLIWIFPSSIRSVERITGIHRDTVMRLGVRVGEGCQQIMDTKMRGLNCSQIEVDEIWGFIGAKRNRADAVGAYGDVWTFIALESVTPIMRRRSFPTWLTGWQNASRFLPIP